jgi:hypothetical protein
MDIPSYEELVLEINAQAAAIGQMREVLAGLVERTGEMSSNMLTMAKLFRKRQRETRAAIKQLAAAIDDLYGDSGDDWKRA